MCVLNINVIHSIVVKKFHSKPDANLMVVEKIVRTRSTRCPKP